jgi:predicted P-loop ATPase
VSTTDELRDAGVPVEPEETQSQLFMTVLRGLGYRFRLNLSDDSIEVNSIGTKLSDIIAARIRMQMRDRGVKRDLKAIEDAYTAEAEANAYHPIKDYFNNLAGKWDGKDRVTELALKLKGDSGIIEYEDGRRVPVHAVYLVRWMIGVVAKALDGLQNPMLTLDGGQGIGKSLLAAWLCPHPDWFVEGPINTQDKDCDVRLMTKLIWEVSELDATTRKADVAALKAFITKGRVTVRKAYGRHDITKDALASFIGTLNATSAGFLADETGSRRFLICRLTSIDWSYRAIDRDQLWAQIYHLYREDGQMPMLSAEETEVQHEINKRYELETPIKDWLVQYFTVTEDDTDMLSMGEIIDHLADKGHRLSGTERAQAMEIGRVLSGLGSTVKHTRTGNRWLRMVVKH